MDNIDAYVRTILVRTFLGERRSPWFRRVLLSGSAQADGVAAGADPDAVLDVREALTAIPPRQRATLVLRFYCDLDVEQSAAVLGCSAGTVKSQTSKGLAAPRSPADVLTIARKLHPIGPDPARWTADLLR